MAQLKIDGRWANTIAPWGGLGWTTKAQGGMHELSWSMDVDTRFRDRSLRTDALVEIYDGPSRIGAGLLQEPDLAEGQFVARGLYRQAENFLALDASLDGTSVPNTAIDQAIARGLLWGRAASFSSVAFTASTATTAPNTLHALLTDFSDSTSAFWYLDSVGFVHNTVPATTPTWFLAPGLTELGVAEDDYASDLFGRRLASGGSFEVETVGDATARAFFGRREAAVDLTTLGVISQAKAESILTGRLAKGLARPSFTKSVDVTPGQLLSRGGVPADLTMVRAGQVVRSHGLFDDIRFLNGKSYLDWLIGETRHEDGSGVITLSPVGLAPRDLAAVLAALAPPSRFVA